MLKHWVIGCAALVVAGTAFVIVTKGPASTSPISMASQSANAFSRVNVIRHSLQHPKGASTTAYSSEVLAGINTDNDPPFAPSNGTIYGEYSLWGIVPGWTASADEVVNDWVYHDGWQGSTQLTLNADCTSATAPGCNGHRRAILSSPPARGATLHIDFETRPVTYQSSQYLAVAALLVWTRPSSIPQQSARY
jgi:hypothetical protein